MPWECRRWTNRLPYSAQRAAEFVWGKLWNGERLGRAWRGGKVRYSGYLDDYAMVIAGFLDVYEVSQEPKWLERALKLQEVQDNQFSDDRGGYFCGGNRRATFGSGVSPITTEPSYGKLGLGFEFDAIGTHGRDSLRGQSPRYFESFAQTLTRSGRAMPKMLAGLDFVLDDALQIILVKPMTKRRHRQS